METFAKTLKELRKQYNMSQADLANVSGIALPTIRNYEQDRDGRSPTLHNLMLLADLFHVSPYFLYFGGEQEMAKNSIYMSTLAAEISQLPPAAILEIHDSPPNGVTLPKLAVSDEIVEQLTAKLNRGVTSPRRGFYRSYVEQTLTRYAQNRKKWKNQFGIK